MAVVMLHILKLYFRIKSKATTNVQINDQVFNSASLLSALAISLTFNKNNSIIKIVRKTPYCSGVVRGTSPLVLPFWSSL
jgi:hypothetical protein